MKYRAKITHCAAIIANLYGTDYKHIEKLGNDIWIVVNTFTEAQLITNIEMHQEYTYDNAQQLEKYLRK